MKVGIDFDADMVFAIVESPQGTNNDIKLHATPELARQIANQLISCAEQIEENRRIEMSGTI